MIAIAWRGAKGWTKWHFEREDGSMGHLYCRASMADRSISIRRRPEQVELESVCKECRRNYYWETIGASHAQNQRAD